MKLHKGLEQLRSSPPQANKVSAEDEARAELRKACFLRKQKCAIEKIKHNKAEHVNVDEPYSMSPELKETFKEVSRSRKSTSRNDSSSRKEYIDSPINAFTNSMSPEEVKMSRINANYEHDKAVLAKTDPAFAAKNQFWDVGHAEESGEVTDRDIEKLKHSLSNNIKNKS